MGIPGDPSRGLSWRRRLRSGGRIVSGQPANTRKAASWEQTPCESDMVNTWGWRAGPGCLRFIARGPRRCQQSCGRQQRPSHAGVVRCAGKLRSPGSGSDRRGSRADRVERRRGGVVMRDKERILGAQHRSGCPHCRQRYLTPCGSAGYTSEGVQERTADSKTTAHPTSTPAIIQSIPGTGRRW